MHIGWEGGGAGRRFGASVELKKASENWVFLTFSKGLEMKIGLTCFKDIHKCFVR